MFQVYYYQYIICIFHCVLITQSLVSIHHHIFDSLYPSNSPPCVHYNYIHKSQDMETAYVSFHDDWMKMWHAHTVEYYWTIKRWNIAVYNNMDGSWEYHAKWNKSDRKNARTIWFNSLFLFDSDSSSCDFSSRTEMLLKSAFHNLMKIIHQTQGFWENKIWTHNQPNFFSVRSHT